ncbi:MAG: hypothetical protein WC222_04330 [Parachlamydiales bacterium]|jgi:hypothetical protein
MLGTIVSVAVAVYLSFHPIEVASGSVNAFAAVIALVGLIMGLALPFLSAMIWRPLQKAELTATPRVTELFHNDNILSYIRYWSLLLPLLMFVLAIDLSITHFIPVSALLAIAVVLLGISLDAIQVATARMSNYLSPAHTLDYFNAAAKKGIKEEKYGEVCAWIDAISEVGVQAARNGRLSLSMQVLDDIHDILRNFLQASKSISHHLPNVSEGKKDSGVDTVSYVLLFAFQRLEMINNKAAEMKLEPICSHVVNILGKIALDAAQYDITTAQYPLLYLGRATRIASEHNIPDISFKSSIALTELAKMLPQKVDTTYLEIAPFYTVLLSQLDQNAKNIFKNDKSISFDVLLQPFNDIKNLFANSSHQDAPAITNMTDNILEQFKTLEDVLTSMAPIAPPSTPIDDEGLSSKIVDDLENRLKGASPP